MNEGFKTNSTPSHPRSRVEMLVLFALFIASMGYWPALSRFCPAWQQLMNKISRAEALWRAGENWLIVKMTVFGSDPPAVLTEFEDLTWAIVMLVFFACKVAFVIRRDREFEALFGYVLLASLITTGAYLHLEDWANPHVTLNGNWFGTPVMLLTVPTISFLFDLFSSGEKSTHWLVIRSLVEGLILLPLWAYCWIWISLAMGFMWI